MNYTPSKFLLDSVTGFQLLVFTSSMDVALGHWDHHKECLEIFFKDISKDKSETTY